MQRLALAWVFTALGFAITPTLTSARVTRFAVVIGHNQGDRDEAPLRYAESDATRVVETLLELGRHAPQDVVLLRHMPADVVRRTLISINERVRQSAAAGDQPMLFVYYSGHADAEALHLGSSRLDVGELRELVAGSAAEVRLLVLDACRSGALTRVKGGRPAAAFAIQVDERLAGQGAVFLTSSAAGEDSQESDQLQGSFFTHYLVSGLLGAADANHDQVVSLAEAYRYAYEHTLRASMRTQSGAQHPTFQYQVRGHGEIPLSYLNDGQAERAQLDLPEGRSYLFLHDAASGPVVAEVSAGDRSRRITLRPGRYHVVARAERYLLEGDVQVAAGSRQRLGDETLERFEYARLVRKGGPSAPSSSHGPQAGYRYRSPLTRGDSACHGAFVGYAWSFASFDLTPRFAFCTSHFENAHVRETTTELSLGTLLTHSWDWGPLTLQLGVRVGTSSFIQRFETRGRAPARTTFALEAGAGTGAQWSFSRQAYLALDGYLATYAYNERSTNVDRLALHPVLLLSAGAGMCF